MKLILNHKNDRINNIHYNCNQNYELIESDSTIYPENQPGTQRLMLAALNSQTIPGSINNEVESRAPKSQSDHISGCKEMHLSYGWNGESTADAKKQRTQYPSVHFMSFLCISSPGPNTKVEGNSIFSTEL